MVYALPTLVFVVVFFIWPLLLVGQMSASDWKLLTGDQGINFPTNYGALNNNPLFWPAVEFTIRYTVIVTVLLIGLGLGLALLVQETQPLGRAAAHRVPASRWPSGSRRRRCCSGASTRTASGPSTRSSQDAGLIDEPILFFATHTNAFLSTVFMIVWKFVGLYMLILLVGLQAIPTELLRGGLDRRRQPLADLPAHHAAAAAPVTRPGADPVRDGLAAGVRPLLLLTKGGPDNSTVTIVQLIYQQAFVRQNLGTAAALSLVLLAALLILNLIWFRLLRRGTAVA